MVDLNDEKNQEILETLLALQKAQKEFFKANNLYTSGKINERLNNVFFDKYKDLQAKFSIMYLRAYQEDILNGKA